MSYLNLDENYFEHLKSKRLKMRLGEIGELIPLRLWCYAAKHFPDTGIFKGHSSEEIAIIAGFNGDPSRMLEALVEFGFMELTSDGYKVHEWEEHQGHLKAFRERAKIANKIRWDKHRLEMDKHKTIDKTPKGIPDGSRLDPPNLPTKPTNKDMHSPAAQEVFAYFCLKLNKKILLSHVRKAIIVERLKEGRSVAEMKLAIDNFSKDTWEERHRFCDIVYVLGTKNRVNNLDKWLFSNPVTAKAMVSRLPRPPKADCFMCKGTGKMSGGSDCSCTN